MIDKLPYRKYKPYELAKIKKQLRYRILIMDKDLKSMLNDIHEIVDKYLKLRNMSHIKVDVNPLYLE